MVTICGGWEAVLQLKIRVFLNLIKEVGLFAFTGEGRLIIVEHDALNAANFDAKAGVRNVAII